MKKPQTAALPALAIGAALLAGCYEDPDVSLHEPGEYQGKTDPLLAIAGSPENNEELAERIRRIQTDR